VLRFQPDGLPTVQTADVAPLRPVTSSSQSEITRVRLSPISALSPPWGEAWHSLRGGAIDSLIRLDLVLSPAAGGGALIDAQA
jgi:hypothetical protein